MGISAILQAKKRTLCSLRDLRNATEPCAGSRESAFIATGGFRVATFGGIAIGDRRDILISAIFGLIQWFRFRGACDFGLWETGKSVRASIDRASSPSAPGSQHLYFMTPDPIDLADVNINRARTLRSLGQQKLRKSKMYSVAKVQNKSNQKHAFFP